MAMPSTIAVPEDASIAQRYEALIRIANSIRHGKTPDQLFDILAHELRQVIPFDGIAQFDESSNKIRWHLGCACTAPGNREQEIHRESTLAAWVYREQKIVAVGNLEDETRFPATISIMCEAGLHSVCAVPLTTAHRRLGTLAIASVEYDAYPPDVVRFFALVADQLALAIDDAISIQESQRANARLQLLLDLTNKVVSSLNLRDVLREVSAQIRQVMQCDGVAVALPGPEDGRLRIYALDFPDAPAHLEEGYEPPPSSDTAHLRAFQS